MLSLQSRDAGLDVRLKRRDGLVNVYLGSLHVMVDVDHVEMALGAVAQELAQERKTGRATTIRDSRGSEKSLAFELLHISFVDCSGIFWAKVGLTCVIWFVGATKLPCQHTRLCSRPWRVKAAHAKRYLVPLWIAAFTVSFHSLFSKLLSTPKVGTKANESGMVTSLPVTRVSPHWGPKLPYLLPTKK